MRARFAHEEEDRPRIARAPAPARSSLAATIGNRAFCELVARSRLARDDVPAEAPTVEKTAFGTFAVHPDDAGPLPIAEPGPGHVWPIHASAFTRLQTAMAEIASLDSAGLHVAGSSDRPRGEFEVPVMLDLAWLQTQPIGAQLIAAIWVTGKNAWIQESFGGNRTVFDNLADASLQSDGSRGKGVNVRIDYNPGGKFTHDGTKPWELRPPAIGLAHELVHAWTGMNGMRAPDVGTDDTPSERQAAGIGEFSDAIMSENRFRAAFGLQPRPEL